MKRVGLRCANLQQPSSCTQGTLLELLQLEPGQNLDEGGEEDHLSQMMQDGLVGKHWLWVSLKESSFGQEQVWDF